MLTQGSRRLLTIAVTAAMVALTGCTSSEPTPDTSTAGTPTAPPLTAGEPDESEVPPGWDQTPDGPPPTPDSELTDADLRELLRTRGSSTATDDTCGPAEVTGRLSGIDAALGHRYTSLVVKNTSSRTCTLEGVPGLGARGEQGHRFTVTVEPGSSVSGATGPVRLAPGAQARSLVEWTGDLAGHDAENASLLVVQLAAGQVPVPVAARVTDVPTEEGLLDIGMFTTIRLGPFEQLP